MMPRLDPQVLVENLAPRWLVRFRAWLRRRRDFHEWDRELRVSDGHIHPLDPERRRR